MNRFLANERSREIARITPSSTFFKTQVELIWRTVFTMAAETAMAGYIDGFYNPVRRHSMDFTSPVKFEAEAMQTV